MHNNNNNKRRNHYHNGKNRNRPRHQQNDRPSINKVYDSSGPTGRQRGNASTLYEKYVNLARDAGVSGDRVLSENLMQHAEHYLRIVHTVQEQMQATYRDQMQKEQPVIQEENSTENTPPAATDFSEESSIKEKPVIRRKSYPFARRRPAEHTDSKEPAPMDNSTDAPQPEVGLKNNPEEAAPVETETLPKVKRTVKRKITEKPSNATSNQESDNQITEAPKPSRVVRKRVVKPKASDKQDDHDKPSNSDET